MFGGRHFTWGLGLLVPVCALQASSSSAPSDARARQNLLFAWSAVPVLVEACLNSSTCVGADRKILESVLAASKLPAAQQPQVIFFPDRESDFCVHSRDVYGTDRIWSAPIRVCEPRLYDPATLEPLWNSEVALLEMSEVAFLKGTPLDDNTVSDLATRLVELNTLRLKEFRHPMPELAAIRVLGIEQPELKEVAMARVMTPQTQFDLVEALGSAHPCETYYDSRTVGFSVRDLQFAEGGSFSAGSWSNVPLVSDTFIDCAADGRVQSYRGKVRWDLSFRWVSPTQFDQESFSIDLKGFRLVGPEL
jgi:hypothetical protein